MSQLGAALAGQGKYAHAEPLMLQGYDGLKGARPSCSTWKSNGCLMPPGTGRSLQRLGKAGKGRRMGQETRGAASNRDTSRRAMVVMLDDRLAGPAPTGLEGAPSPEPVRDARLGGPAPAGSVGAGPVPRSVSGALGRPTKENRHAVAWSAAGRRTVLRWGQSDTDT